MQPLVRAAAFAALLAAVGALGKTSKAPAAAPPPALSATFAEAPAVSCGPRMLPEGDACLPLPKVGAAEDVGDLQASLEGGKLEASRREMIPRRPERPVESSAYHFPLAGDTSPVVLGGFGRPFGGAADLAGKTPGPGVVLLSATRGEEVVALTLEGQEGPAEVAFVGDLVGETVVTAHLVHEGGRLRQILLVFAGLDRPSPRVVEGVPLEPGEVIGYAGDSASPGRPALWLEARQLREGQTLGGLDKTRLGSDLVSVAIDARNVLPLHGASL